MEQQQKAHWGLYNMMSNILAPMYFFFTPTISIVHYENTVQGGVYIGWLNYCLFLPYDDDSKDKYEFYLLPLIAWRQIENTKIISLSWLFWTIDFPYNSNSTTKE